MASHSPMRDSGYGNDRPASHAGPDWWLMGRRQEARSARSTTCSPPTPAATACFRRISSIGHAGLLDYHLGEHKAAAWRMTHGTHVMDAACGYDPRTTGSTGRSPACSFPTPSPPPSTTAISIPFSASGVGFIIMSMLNYCLERASRRSRSSSTSATAGMDGPHDGRAPSRASSTGSAASATRSGSPPLSCCRQATASNVADPCPDAIHGGQSVQAVRLACPARRSVRKLRPDLDAARRCSRAAAGSAHHHRSCGAAAIDRRVPSRESYRSAAMAGWPINRRRPAANSTS